MISSAHPTHGCAGTVTPIKETHPVVDHHAGAAVIPCGSAFYGGERSPWIRLQTGERDARQLSPPNIPTQQTNKQTSKLGAAPCLQYFCKL